MNFLKLILIILTFSSLCGASETRYLFSAKFTSVPDYYVDKNPEEGLYVDGRIIKNGDTLIFDTGESVVFKKYLGSGQNTIIFLDSLNRAFRLTQFIDERSIQMFVGYLETQLILSKHLPAKNLVQLDPKYQTQSDRVIVTEWLPIEGLLSHYFDPNVVMSEKKFKALVDFFETFRGIYSVGDLSAHQIGYVHNRGWVLFDFGPGVVFNKYTEPASSAVLQIAQLESSLNPKLLKRLLEKLRLRDYVFYAAQNTKNSCQNYLIQE